MACVFGLLFVVASSYLYEKGRKHGRQDQRQTTNRGLDAIHQQGHLAQNAIDYLYEQARWHILAKPGEHGSDER